jgi:plastocyanin
MMRRSIVMFIALTSLAIPARADMQEFFIATVHLDGKTSTKGDEGHPAEPFPVQQLPKGDGLVRKAPDADGVWSIRMFVFEPQQVVVRQGDEVRLHFVGVQGPTHRIEIDGQASPIVLRRGEMRAVNLKASEPGLIRFRSIGRGPTMQGQVLVLPNP